jgi:hypothetical protein
LLAGETEALAEEDRVNEIERRGQPLSAQGAIDLVKVLGQFRKAGHEQGLGLRRLELEHSTATRTADNLR